MKFFLDTANLEEIRKLLRSAKLCPAPSQPK